MGKRVLLFLGTNLLVVLGISIVLSVLHIQPYLTEFGLNVPALAGFCLVYGMVGAFISLAISRVTAKWFYKIQLVSPSDPDPRLKDLCAIVHELARKANLPAMPEVGIYQSAEMNAFATGPTKARSLVAVSTGLLTTMDREALSGVLGHEISHVANGDMVTMTLLQGIVNAFVMFLSRAIAYVLCSSRDEEGESMVSSLAYFVTRTVLEIVFMMLGYIIVNWYSRRREYRADAGGAELSGTHSMVKALQILRQQEESGFKAKGPSPLKAMMINSGRAGMLAQLFSSHPPLEDRIAKLMGPSGNQEFTDIVGGELPQRSTEAPRSSNSLRDRFSDRP